MLGLIFLKLIIVLFERVSAIQKSLGKNHVITTIHPQASRTDQLPGSLQQSKDETQGLIASSSIASICTCPAAGAR